MKIKAAEDLRGELVLGSIHKSLTRGKEIVISDDSFWNDDIQLMLKAKKITVTEGGENFPDVANLVEERIAIQSAYRKPVELTGIPFPIAPGQVYSVTRKQLSYESVQQALDMGLIVLCDPDEQPFDVAKADEELPEGEAPLKRKDPLKDVDLDKLDEAERFHYTKQAKTLINEKPAQPKNMYAYDPHEGRNAPKTPPNARTYDPNVPAIARASNKLPVRGAIKPVGMTQSPLQEAQLKQAQAQLDTPRRINAPQPAEGQQRGPKRIRPIGGGERGISGVGGDDALTCEII